MIYVHVYNIVYDTVSDDFDWRYELDASDIPVETVLEMEDDYEDDDDLGDMILKEIENDWLVDRFDWKIIAPTPSVAHHHEDPCREQYGVSIFPFN